MHLYQAVAIGIFCALLCIESALLKFDDTSALLPSRCMTNIATWLAPWMFWFGERFAALTDIPALLGRPFRNLFNAAWSVLVVPWHFFRGHASYYLQHLYTSTPYAIGIICALAFLVIAVDLYRIYVRRSPSYVAQWARANYETGRQHLRTLNRANKDD